MRDALFANTMVLIFAVAGASAAGCGNGEKTSGDPRPSGAHAGGSAGSAATPSSSGGQGGAGPAIGPGGDAGSSGTSAGESAGGEAGETMTGGAGASVGGQAGESGDGGAAGAETLGVTGPLDKSVLEGANATFLVIASGRGLVYQWQRQPITLPFADVAGATSSMLTLPAVQLSDDRTLFRVIVSDGVGSVTSRAAMLQVIPRSAGASVSVAASSGLSQEDPAYTTWNASSYAGTADLTAGTLASSAFTPNNQAQASARLSVVLYNNTGSVVSIAAGNLSAHVESRYVGSALYQNTTSLITSAVLGASVDGTASLSAHIEHQVSLAWANGMVVTSISDVRTTESPGARVNVLTESSTALGAELSLPAFAVRAGERLWITASLTTSSYGGTTDAMDPPMRLQLVLPPGVSLDSNASVALDWVTN